MSELLIRDDPARHRFQTDLGDGSVAFAEYLLLTGRIIFTHTEVPPEHEGKGIGTALVRYALGEARKRKLLVIPKCPFFVTYMQKHAQERDLLDPAWRKKLELD